MCKVVGVSVVVEDSAGGIAACVFYNLLPSERTAQERRQKIPKVIGSEWGGIGECQPFLLCLDVVTLCHGFEGIIIYE